MLLKQKNLQQLFNEFIYECEYVRKTSSETIRCYSQTFSLFLKLMPESSLETLNESSMVRFFEILQKRKRYVGKGVFKEGVKKSTVAAYWNKLNAFFRWLEHKAYIDKNPFHTLRCPTPQYDDRKFLKKEDVEKILASIHLHCGHSLLVLKRNLVFLYILLFCGLRKEELLLLQVQDIDFDRRTVTIRGDTSKSGRTRILPLHSILTMHLKDYLETRKNYTTPYLFVSNKRNYRLTDHGLKHLVNRLKEFSGVQFHLHQLRHTFAVNFLKHSNNVAKLKQLLGHKSIAMTMTYLRCLPVTELKGDIDKMHIDSFI